ncbi:MAG: hypothetical protein ACT4QF_23465 [Sporichthyaceae bacterium]
MAGEEHLPPEHREYVPPPDPDGVPDEEWASFAEAARVLGVRRPRAVSRAARGHLDPGRRRSDGHPGVTRGSLAGEVEWQRSAGRLRRARRRIADVLGNFSGW